MEGDQSSCTVLLVRPLFSEARNPFLFPLRLLDREAEFDQETESSDTSHVGGIDSGVAASFEEEVSSRNDSPVWSNDCQGIFDGDSGEGDEGSHWWLLHTKPRQEKKLAEELRRLETPHYLPVTKCKAVTRGRTRFTHVPQFPSYFFLFATAEQRRRALQTNRIVATHRIVEHDALRKQLFVLADLIEKGFPLTVEARLVPGTWVRVTAGVLKDREGTIVQRGGKTRLFVFINELLGGVSVEVEQHLLEPYGDPPAELRG